VIARALCAIVLAACASPAMAAEDATWRDALLELAKLRERNLHVRWPAPLASPNGIPAALAATSPEAFAAFEARLPPVQPLFDRLTRAAAALEQHAGALPALPASPKAIGFPNPDPLADCAGATGGAASSMLDAWGVSAELLAAAKWGCIETPFGGTNAAALCTALSIETEALETEYELESFCLGVQSGAIVSAVHDTQANVVEFVNLRADAMVSSRASQASLDALQASLDGLLLQLVDLRTALAVDDNATTAGLADILDRAIGLATRLTALSADVQDVRFRAQVVQAGLDDAQQQLEAAKAQASRLVALGSQLRTHLASLRTALDAADSTLQASIAGRRERSLAAALGEPERVILRYRLPAQRGGELERSRELLIRALAAYRALGADTTTAQALLVNGDAAFNEGRVLDAYDAYARAYRSLLDTSTQLSVLIMGDSFE
jgi:hypothetical protein